MRQSKMTCAGLRPALGPVCRQGDDPVCV